ncbi:hypothetical protein ACWEOZ_10950 [Actinoplanes sp. NPDC004185]
MRRLSCEAGRWRWQGDPDTDLSALGTSFPEQDAFAEEYAAFYETPQPVSDLAARARRHREEEELLRRQTSGAIYLGEEGHNFSLLLIVSGPQRNTVWFDRRPTTDTIIPLYTSDGRPATFTDIYLDWLEAAEHLIASGRKRLELHEIRSPIYETRFSG